MPALIFIVMILRVPLWAHSVSFYSFPPIPKQATSANAVHLALASDRSMAIPVKLA